MGVIGKVSAGITMSSGAGGIITASTVALFPVTIALDGIAVVRGISLLVSTKLNDCFDKIKLVNIEILNYCQ